MAIGMLRHLVSGCDRVRISRILPRRWGCYRHGLSVRGLVKLKYLQITVSARAIRSGIDHRYKFFRIVIDDADRHLTSRAEGGSGNCGQFARRRRESEGADVVAAKVGHVDITPCGVQTHRSRSCSYSVGRTGYLAQRPPGPDT